MKESESQREFSDDETSNLEISAHEKCETCGEEYGRPLFAENLSGPSPEEYYACSRCLSKIEATPPKRTRAAIEEEHPTEEEVKQEIVSEEVEEAPTIQGDKIEVNIQSSCQHDLGYLKKRDKGSPIPDECLICTKMIDCM